MSICTVQIITRYWMLGKFICSSGYEQQIELCNAGHAQNQRLPPRIQVLLLVHSCKDASGYPLIILVAQGHTAWLEIPGPKFRNLVTV